MIKMRIVQAFIELEVSTLLGGEEEVIWQARRKAFSHFSVWLLQAALDQ